MSGDPAVRAKLYKTIIAIAEAPFGPGKRAPASLAGGGCKDQHECKKNQKARLCHYEIMGEHRIAVNQFRNQKSDSVKANGQN